MRWLSVSRRELISWSRAGSVAARSSCSPGSAATSNSWPSPHCSDQISRTSSSAVMERLSFSPSTLRSRNSGEVSPGWRCAAGSEQLG
eukprot:4821198-Prymnesium_polylepis.1